LLALWRQGSTPLRVNFSLSETEFLRLRSELGKGML
jgi:hypothetical protein